MQLNFSVNASKSSLDEWSVNLGHSAKIAASSQINKRFKDPKFKREVNDILLSKLAIAINKVNALGVVIPRYSGSFVAGLFGGWFNNTMQAIIRIGEIMQAGSSKGVPLNKAESILNWVQQSNAHITEPRFINTGGALNPDMAYIWSEQFVTGNILPPYWVKVEFHGWRRTQAYDVIRGTTAVIEQMEEESKQDIRSLL